MRCAGEHQRVNAALAVALCSAWEQAQSGPPLHGRAERVQQLQARHLPATYAQGLLTCHWPGRSQVRSVLDPALGEPATVVTPSLRISLR